MKSPVFILFAVLFAFSACSGGASSDQNSQSAESAVHDTSAEQGNSTAKSAIDEAKAAVARTEQAQLPEGGEITITGILGCGHCTYHVTDTCKAAVRTADGSVFILDVAQDSPWFQNRYSGARLEITGKVHHDGKLVVLQSTSITEL